MTSKRHPTANSSTGPDAANLYRLKHPHGLRQLQRYLRIAASLRPLTFDVPTKRERKVATRYLERM